MIALLSFLRPLLPYLIVGGLLVGGATWFFSEIARADRAEQKLEQAESLIAGLELQAKAQAARYEKDAALLAALRKERAARAKDYLSIKKQSEEACDERPVDPCLSFVFDKLRERDSAR